MKLEPLRSQPIEAGASSPATPIAPEALYRLHGRACFSLARQIIGDDQLAQDVVHDVFAALGRQPGRYGPARGTVQTWLLSRTHRQAVEVIRRPEWRHLRRSADQLVDMLATSVTPAPIGMSAHQGRGSVLALPHAEREVIVLAYYGGYTQGEIAVLTHSPLDTVRRRAQAAMRLLATDAPDVRASRVASTPTSLAARPHFRLVRRLRLLLAVVGPCAWVAIRPRPASRSGEWQGGQAGAESEHRTDSEGA